MFDNAGTELEFTSEISINDTSNITKGGLDTSYKSIIIPIFSTGEIEITLTSLTTNIVKSFKIVVK